MTATIENFTHASLWRVTWVAAQFHASKQKGESRCIVYFSYVMLKASIIHMLHEFPLPFRTKLPFRKGRAFSSELEEEAARWAVD